MHLLYCSEPAKGADILKEQKKRPCTFSPERISLLSIAQFDQVACIAQIDHCPITLLAKLIFNFCALL